MSKGNTASGGVTGGAWLGIPGKKKSLAMTVGEERSQPSSPTSQSKFTAYDVEVSQESRQGCRWTKGRHYVSGQNASKQPHPGTGKND